MKKYIYELMTDQRHGPMDRLIQGLLWILSLGYGLIVMVTRGLYKFGILSVYRSSKPVISVGNITSGGVGKTPLVIWIAETLTQEGIKTAVLSRGYKAQDGMNDETKMFKQILPQVPIYTGRDRGASIEQAISQGPVDVFVADDAFQHWPLSRQLDIVAIDAANPFGNGYLVPRGILREELTALKRAHVFVLTKADRSENLPRLKDQLQAINPKALMVESKHAAIAFKDLFNQSKVDLKASKIISFCSIGDPSSLEHTLQKAGAVTVKSMVYPDHHHYTKEDINEIVSTAKRENINILVTTHKDAVKIQPFKGEFQGMTVVVIDIKLEITQGQDEFIKRILSVSRA